MIPKKYTSKLQVYLTQEDLDTLKAEAESDNRPPGEWARIQIERLLKKNAGLAGPKMFQLVEVGT